MKGLNFLQALFFAANYYMADSPEAVLPTSSCGGQHPVPEEVLLQNYCVVARF